MAYESDFQLEAGQLNKKQRSNRECATWGRARLLWPLLKMRTTGRCMLLTFGCIGTAPAKLLVTEDYKFFKAFVRSRFAEDVLRELVTAVLQIGRERSIRVKLAGEVIPGM